MRQMRPLSANRRDQVTYSLHLALAFTALVLFPLGPVDAQTESPRPL
jgi:hypothetical protein